MNRAALISTIFSAAPKAPWVYQRSYPQLPAYPQTHGFGGSHLPDFNAALRHANALMSAQPASIETVDSTVLNLAMQDNAWQEVAEFFPSSGAPVQGINLVEFIGDELEALEALPPSPNA